MATKLSISTVLRMVDRVTRPVTRMRNSVRRFTRSAQRGMRQLNRVAGKVTRTIGTGVRRGFQVASTAALAFGAALAKVIQVGAGFEKTLVSAAVRFGPAVKPGTAAFKDLENAARLAGKTTEFTAAQSASALQEIGQAGFGLRQSIAALPGVIDLATNSGLELAEASLIATNSLNAMGLKVDDTAKLSENLSRVNDALAYASSNSSTNVAELFESISSGGVVVKEAGQDIETFAALTGILADSNIKGEKAGTALRNIFLRLQAPVGAARGLIKKYVGSVQDAEGNMLSITEIMSRMEKRLEGLGGVEKAQIFDTIFGKKAIIPGMVLMNAGSKKVADFAQEIRDATGASKEMAATMRNTTSGSIDALKSAVEGVVISLFKLKDGALKGTIDSMVQWVRENEKLITSKIGDFIKNIVDNFGQIVTTIKAIGATIATIWALATAIKAVAAILTVVNLIMLANPITLIVMGIVAAVAIAAGLIVYYWDDIKAAWGVMVEFFSDLWDSVTAMFSSAVDALIHSGPISWFIAAAALMFEAYKWLLPKIAGVWSEMVDIFTDAIDWIANTGPVRWLIKAATWLTDVWGKVSQFFKDMWSEITSVFKTALANIAEFFAPVTNLIGGLIDGASELFGGISDAKDNLIEGAFGASDTGAGVMTPSERTASLFEQRNMTTTNKSEVTIRDETGRAEVTEGNLGTGMSLMPTGTF